MCVCVYVCANLNSGLGRKLGQEESVAVAPAAAVIASVPLCGHPDLALHTLTYTDTLYQGVWL